MTWSLYARSQNLWETKPPIYTRLSFWMACAVALIVSITFLRLRSAELGGPGERQVPATWRPSWTIRKSRSAHQNNSPETPSEQSSNPIIYLNEAERLRYTRGQTEFASPLPRTPSPPRTFGPNRVLRIARDQYDATFPRHNKRFDQGIWVLSHRADKHECSNPYLFEDLEESSLQDKKLYNIWGRGTVILYLSDNLANTSCSPLYLDDVLYIRSSHFTNHHIFSPTSISCTVRVCNYDPGKKDNKKQLIEADSGRWLGEVKKDWVYKKEKGWIVRTCPYNVEHCKVYHPVVCPNHGWWPWMIRWYDRIMSWIYA